MSPCYWQFTSCFTSLALQYKQQFLRAVNQETDPLFEPKTFFLGYHFNIPPAAGIQWCFFVFVFFKVVVCLFLYGPPPVQSPERQLFIINPYWFPNSCEKCKQNSRWLVFEHFPFHDPPSLSLCIYVYQSSGSWFGNNQKQIQA